MNALETAIQREGHEADLWRHFHPGRAKAAEERLVELQDELAKIRQEERDTLVAFALESEPGLRPQDWLCPMGIDDALDCQFIVDTETGIRRPR